MVMTAWRLYLLAFSGFQTEEEVSASPQVRRCSLCGLRLSRYNPRSTCLSHDAPDPQAQAFEKAVASVAAVFGVSAEAVFAPVVRGRPVLRHCVVYVLKVTGFSHLEIFEFLPDDAAHNTLDQYRAWERNMRADSELADKTKLVLDRMKEP